MKKRSDRIIRSQTKSYLGMILLGITTARRTIMTTLKRFASALTVCALLATTSLVASADDSASLYQTTNGGPTHLSETLEIYKNTGNSYYAECTYITSGTLRVTGNNNTPDKTLSFTTEKRIDFLATTNESTLRFTAKLTPPSSTTPSQANITIGA